MVHFRCGTVFDSVRFDGRTNHSVSSRAQTEACNRCRPMWPELRGAGDCVASASLRRRRGYFTESGGDPGVGDSQHGGHIAGRRSTDRASVEGERPVRQSVTEAEPVLLDTDTLSELSRGNATVSAQAQAYLRAFGRFTISSVTVFERLRGYRQAIQAGKPFHKQLTPSKRSCRTLWCCRLMRTPPRCQPESARLVHDRSARNWGTFSSQASRWPGKFRWQHRISGTSRC